MPLPIAAYAAAAYSAAMANLSTAGPVIAVSLLGFAAVASHDPNRLETALLKENPEAAAECVARVVTANTNLAAAVVPLHGTAVMGVTLRSERRGDPLMNIVIHQQGAVSQAEFHPLDPAQAHSDVIGKIIAGC
jgi:hypothetical protein